MNEVTVWSLIDVIWSSDRGPTRAAQRHNVYWEWSAEDPFAVHLHIENSTHWVEWVFSRDLAHDILLGKAGIGDVYGSPQDHGCLRVGLRNGSSGIEFHTPAGDLAEFLNKTYDASLPGQESGVDRAVDRFLETLDAS